MVFDEATPYTPRYYAALVYRQKISESSNGHLQTRTEVASKHWLDIIYDVERRLGLCFDFVDGDTVSELNEGQTTAKVNIKNALKSQPASTTMNEMRTTIAYQFRNDP